MALFARFRYGGAIIPSDHSTIQSSKHRMPTKLATWLTSKEFVRILLTPDPELIKAVHSLGKTDGEPHNFTTTAKDMTSVLDKTVEQGTSTSHALILDLPPQGSVTSVSAPAPAGVSRRRIRFDPKPPSIKILAQDRVKGPPQLPREERLYTAPKRATWEYRQDSEL